MNKVNDALYVQNYLIEDGVLTLTVHSSPITPETSPNDAGDQFIALGSIDTGGLVIGDRSCFFILLRTSVQGPTHIRFKNETDSSGFYYKLCEGLKDFYTAHAEDEDPER